MLSKQNWSVFRWTQRAEDMTKVVEGLELIDKNVARDALIEKLKEVK